MPHVQPLVAVVFASLIASSAWAQEVPNRNLDENPFKDEKPKPVSAPRAALRVAPVQVIAPPIRPQQSTEIFINGVGRLITFEPPDPHPIDADGLDDPQVPQAAPPFIQFDLKTAIVSRDNFDRWIFGDGITEEARSAHLDMVLLAKLEKVAREHRLTAQQRSKLRLAGQGDIKRFLDLIEERRPEFESVRKEFRAWLKFLRETDSLSASYQNGPFDDDSLFAKTLAKIENDRKESR